MKVFDDKGDFPEDQWEAAGLYKVVVFEKRPTTKSIKNTNN